MPVPSISITPPFSAIQTPADESAPRASLATDRLRESLAKHVDALQAAALAPAALEYLAAAILDQEHAPCERALAMLLYPANKPGVDVSCKGRGNLPPPNAKNPESPSLPSGRTTRPTDASQATGAMHASEQKSRMQIKSVLWENHISYVTAEVDNAIQGLENKLEREVNGIERKEHKVKASLLDFLVDYQNEHPDEAVIDLLHPFNDLVQRGIQLPDNLPLAFMSGILPFDALRRLVSTYVSQLPDPTPEQTLFPAAADSWAKATSWEQSLGAACSPLAMAILDGGRMTPEMLSDWTGLKKRKEGPGLDQTQQGTEFFPPSGLSEPITVLLAGWHLLNDSEFNRARTSKAALLEHPEKLRDLADSLVPFPHIAYFLSIADLVDGSVLEREMDRVAGEYKRLNANASAEERADFYRGVLGTLNPEQREHMEESWRNMTPYLLVNILRDDERLSTWTASKASDGGQDAPPHLERRPASALFDNWTSRNIPVEHQALMGLFMVQGFDETWAQNAVKAYADAPARMQAWFAQDPDADLYFRLDDAMQAAVMRWLGDKNITPHTLALVPSMIQSDMSVAQIDEILRVQSIRLYFRISGDFAPHANTQQKVQYGVVTPAQLLDRVLHENAYDIQRRDDEEEELREISELNKRAGEAREDFRRVQRAIEVLRAGMRTDTPHARRCEHLGSACDQVVAVLDEVLRPRTETRWLREGQEIDDKLAALVAKLKFEPDLAEPAIPAQGLQQFA